MDVTVFNKEEKRMDMKRPHLCVAALTLALLAAPAAADLSNGDFGTGDFTDWTANPFGPGNTFVAGETAFVGSETVDAMGDPVAPGEFYQTFLLDAPPAMLTFELDFSSADPDTFDFLDFALWKGEFGDFGLDPFWMNDFPDPTDTFLQFGMVGGVPEVLTNFGGGVLGGPGSVLSFTYALDLTGLGLGAGDKLTLDFFFFDDRPDGVASLASVDNVDITPIPAPGSVSLAMIALCAGAVIRRRFA